MNVSVIVPIYNVERFIARCATSLMEQTLKDVEYIFVDDASPDKSMEILQDCLRQYPDRCEQIRIITHTENKGLPAARNSGLQAATGEFVFHCDSDDYLEPNALKTMYETANEQDADIVWCDWFLSFEKNERYMKQPVYDTPEKALKGLLGGAMKYNVWNKLVRRRLYVDNGICFPDGYGMGEDMTMIMLFACAVKVCYLPHAFYHYVKLNNFAFTQAKGEAMDRNLIALQYNVQRIVQFLKGRFGNSLEQDLAFFKLEVKFPFLITDDKTAYHRWSEWFPEANRYIMQNHHVSFRSRLLQYMAAKGQFWYVCLYYRLVIRLIYGVVYK